jgi:transcriptional regulator with GAF, ATPase, and Fis domain
LERALILSADAELVFDLAPKAAPKPQNDNVATLDAAIATHIEKALAKTHGKIYGGDGAAALLGLKPSTLQSKMKKLGVDPPKR